MFCIEMWCGLCYLYGIELYMQTTCNTEYCACWWTGPDESVRYSADIKWLLKPFRRLCPTYVNKMAVKNSDDINM